jgi:hypothetical protein
MPHDPVGSRVWVNTGYGITSGTVVGNHINTPGVRQITLDGGGLVHAVQQSAGFSDLDDDRKNEVSKWFEAGREPLEENFKYLRDDVQFLTDWLAGTDKETKRGTLHQSVRYDRLIKPALEEILRESNIGSSIFESEYDFRDAVKDKIILKLDQKTAELKAINRKLNKMRHGNWICSIKYHSVPFMLLN